LGQSPYIGAGVDFTRHTDQLFDWTR